MRLKKSTMECIVYWYAYLCYLLIGTEYYYNKMLQIFQFTLSFISCWLPVIMYVAEYKGLELLEKKALKVLDFCKTSGALQAYSAWPSLRG